ncbi:Aste57867_9661 [Aphanomyces stellatus]|uniref:sulfite oxidase n=1 Tax=Aphanomyces stellatus TaxID=120398 RepID=A0A485KND8_9STRA|nr:hypothetical protein As57867_009623 [Aphanomyces stellatus]VFT86540.1 Aste57867_9661 [Aphanomyces stellatus]
MLRIKSLGQALRRGGAASTATSRLGKTPAQCARNSIGMHYLHNQQAAATSLDRPGRHSWAALAAVGLGATAVALTDMTRMEEKSSSENDVDAPAIVPGLIRPDLPTYSLDDVSTHVSAKPGASGIWVVYKNGVYDVTKFIAKHPGGTKILLAAGKSIEPFWQVYAAHNHGDVHGILEGLRVGNLDRKDVEMLEAERKKLGDGPYANDPKRNPMFKVNASQPFNAEPPSELLTESFITPNELFFVRNHLPVPDVNLSSFKLEIEGLGVRSGDPNAPNVISLSLDDLKKNFKQHTIVTTIQCAGNRRAEMSAIKPVKGLSWDTTAVSTAKWTGVLLSDVLAHIGISEDQHCKPFPTACLTCDNLPLDHDCPACTTTIEHCHLEGLDRDVTGQCYGASIPISTALDPRKDVLLAYSMNDEPIPRDHGFPLRAIVPGTVGARNVKFLGRIVLSNEEYQGFWQQKDYRGYAPDIDYATPEFEKFAGPSIQELPIQSAITEPKPGQTWPLEGSDEVDVMTIKGYAWSGGGRNIIRVDVSIDGGKTWQEATLDPLGMRQRYNRAWAWTPWTLDVDVDDATTELNILCKAVDASYNVQPDTIAPIWNMRGVLNNAWHRVHVPVQKPERKEENDDEASE